MSEPVRGKATNNMAEIQAATYAVELAQASGLFVCVFVMHVCMSYVLYNYIFVYIYKYLHIPTAVFRLNPMRNRFLL